MRIIAVSIIVILMVSWCWINNHTWTLKSNSVITSNQERVVQIRQKTSIPCFENCTSTHVWYAWAQETNLFRTVRHVLMPNIDQLIVQWSWACWIKQLWNHPTQDLSLIQTVWSCAWWIIGGSLASWKHQQWIRVTDHNTQSISFREHEWFLLASWLFLAPWMSWSPLISQTWALIWLVHAQTALWTTFVDLTQRWNDLLSLSKE